MMSDWFVWEGWKLARSIVVELVADFFVTVSLWVFYALFPLIAHFLIEDELVKELAEAIHSCAAIISFSLLAGLGLLRIVTETRK